MKINILTTDVFNKISAGEVVERPASIIKELVENAIDAGANKIEIEITDGGLKEIIVTDNGCGIESDEVEKAFMPHATSKIKTAEDLDNISSLGFRGEALASIAAVSHVEMITKTEEQDFGTKLVVLGGKKHEKTEVGAVVGTKIVVKNLFYNTPARLKFLKKPKSEESEITHLVSKLILANPTLSFRYSADNKILFNTFGNGLAEALYIVYGKEVYDNLVEVNSQSGELSISGYIARPTLCKPNRSYGTLFVNGRLVSNHMVFAAILDALEGHIMKGRFPIFALNISLPFEDVDVNVHPSKQEVKFANPGKIYGFVSNAIYKAIADVNYVQEIKSEQPQQVEPANLNILKENEGSSFNKFSSLDLLFDKKAENKFAENNSKLVEVILNNENKAIIGKIETPEIIREDLTSQTKIENVFESYEIVGTLFKTYIILQKEDNIFLIDQHAAHERQRYDKIMQGVNSGNILTQNLLVPIILQFNEKELEFLRDNLEKFKSFGFKIKVENELKIFEVPYILSDMDVKEFFDSVLAEMEMFKNKPLSYINERFTQLACKSAVKAGNNLSRDEIDVLLKNFQNTKTPLLCPHGRPIVLKFNKTEIEKLFRRIV
ncbi:MAG: DNA mismatch repair endonuclease MutL [Clostridia bacterium]|nr:DNA mismatch repair endonuclease MutL [Clostridia bacterium]